MITLCDTWRKLGLSNFLLPPSLRRPGNRQAPPACCQTPIFCVSVFDRCRASLRSIADFSLILPSSISKLQLSMRYLASAKEVDSPDKHVNLGPVITDTGVLRFVRPIFPRTVGGKCIQ
ncbi:hypothetical protein PM082_015120 [Marasmius tenuissimus]|nr:hypothetical protein PM082_024519 [Marasmius tenuissimus]KAJ8091402.1 hypothetical protein PM082_015120 [Marasmius tenuissimus]